MLQTTIVRADGTPVETIAEMQAALAGSKYVLQVADTEANGNTPMIETDDETERVLLMTGADDLPSGYQIEAETP